MVSPAVLADRIRFAGLGCFIGGLLIVVISNIESLLEVPPIIVDLIAISMNLGLACGPLGVLALSASWSGRTRRVGYIGTSITLLGICSYLAAILSKYFVGHEVEFFYPIGAFLLGVGMLTLGITAFVAQWLKGWRRMAPLFVGLYYVVMIPLQIVFFIIPNGEPSPILLELWSVTWILLGYALWSSRTPLK
ncbi:hypothetical protein [Paenibacillus sp. MBLB4367]|uniref:hypothetical protein n=1 Tax=Paenibacillus sp. MBLB4367 TaxID=3384767 RepID=UPI00390813C6